MLRTNGTYRRTAIGLGLTLALATAASEAQLPSPPPGGYTVNDVVSQYNLLAHHPDPLAVDIGVGLDATLCKHYQGIARYNTSDGTPYFFISRSGHHGSIACATSACAFDCSDDPAELVVAQMGSRPRHGERMRSNLLWPGESIKDTEPPAADVVLTSIVFDGTGGWPGWLHAGGMQLVDDVLVVPMEREYNGESERGSLLFLDVRSPLDPQIVTEIEFEEKLGVVGITRDPVTGRYLIVFSGGDTQTLDWYETVGTDLLDPNLDITYLDTWDLDDADVNSTVHDKWEKWQNLNFIRQTDGTLFLGVADNTDPEDDSDSSHWSRLFEVNRTGNTFNFTYRAEQKLKLDDPRTGNAAASTGFYISPSGQLILYTGEHDNKGPADSIRCGEIRSINMSTTGTDPISDVWVELYKDDTGWFDNDSPSPSLMLENLDITRENWLDLDDENGWGDDADSLRYRAPVGHQILLFKDQDFGGAVLRLTGNGNVQSISDLDAYNFGGAIHSVFAGTLAVPPASNIQTYITVLGIYVTAFQYQGATELALFGGVYFQTLVQPAPGQTVLIRSSPDQESLLIPSP